MDSIAVRLQPDHSHIWAHDPHPEYAEDADELLSRFLTWLKTGDEPAVLAAVNHAVPFCRMGVLWSRFFMAAAERGGALVQCLCSYAASPEFLLAHDTRKDAIDLLAAQYDQLPEAERRALEIDLLARPFDGYAHPELAKKDFLRRLFGTIGSEHLSTHEAKAVLAASPEITVTNSRLFSITSSCIDVSDDYYWLDKEVRAKPAVREAMAALDLVREKLRLGIGDNESIEDLEAALSALSEVHKCISDAAIPDKDMSLHAEGSFAQGLHKLVNSELIGPDTGQNMIMQLVDWIEDASCFGNPEVKEDTETEFEQCPHWGAPSARLEAAAAALDLCLKRPEIYRGLECLIDRMLTDPHPAVRMNAAQHLVRIWDIDRDGFWHRAARIVQTEANRSVLEIFISHTLAACRVGHFAADNAEADPAYAA